MLCQASDQGRAEDNPNPDPAPPPVAGETAAQHECSGSTAATYVGVQPEEFEEPFVDSPVNAVKIAGVTPGAPSDPALGAGRAQLSQR